MSQTFTPNDMIAYLYGETTPAQTKLTENALAADPVLRHELSEMVQMQTAFKQVCYKPRQRLIRFLRDYASIDYNFSVS